MTEAAEVGEEMRFGSASQLLETLTASINDTLKHQIETSNKLGRLIKPNSTSASLKLNNENKSPKRMAHTTNPNNRNLPALGVRMQRDWAGVASQPSDNLRDISKVER